MEVDLIRFDNAENNHLNGLVLAGGGARAAYQIGLLKALRQCYSSEPLPFKIISGMSAGSINGAVLASQADSFERAVNKAELLWQNISPEKVFKTRNRDLIKSVYQLCYSLFHHGQGKKAIGLLDSAPLWRYARHHIDFEAIRNNINNDVLHAVGISASSYANGGSLCFFEANEDIGAWNNSRRYGVKAKLGPEHVVASCAIPLIFPAVKIGRHHYGDGAMRQLSPISNALHLGAKKLMVIGLSNNSLHRPLAEPKAPSPHTPSFAGLLGQLFNSAFIDAFDSDVENLTRVNQLVGIAKNADPNVALGAFNSVDVLVMNPSQALDEIARKHIHRMPKPIQRLLNVLGASHAGGGISLASYLMFDGDFCKELIQIGYEDGMKQQDMLKQFFGVD